MNINKVCLNTLLVAYFFIVPLGSVLGHYGIKGAFETFKIVFLLFVMMGVIPVLRILLNPKLSPILALLMFGFFYSLIRGWDNNISSYFASHIYSGLMPILMVAYGRELYRKYGGDVDDIFSIFNYIALPLFLLIIIYFVAYKFGFINYFGVSTQAAFLAVYFLVKKDGAKLNAILATLTIFLSGKRGGLLTLLSGGGYLFIRGLINNPKKFILLFFPLLIGVSMALWLIAEETELLNRFTPVLKVDITNEQSLFLATGGRSLEVSSIAKHIQEENILLSGGGAGESFILLHNLREDSDFSIKGFSHFSPLSLTLVYGLPYTIAVYLMLIYIALRCRNDDNGILSVFLVMGLFSSLGGSVLMYDPFFWFVVGLASIEKKKRSHEY